MPIDCTCKICGSQFKRKSSQVLKNRNSYCSKQCYYSVDRKTFAWKRQPLLERNCEFCAKPFAVRPSRIRTSTQGRFCSLKCHRESTVRPLEDRFWESVDKSGECWLWIKATDRDGYGVTSTKNKKQVRAHRVSWEIHFGPIPDGLCVLHNCPGGDNPTCVRPSHLWLGTNDQNMADRKAKGRYANGRDQHGRYVTKSMS